MFTSAVVCLQNTNMALTSLPLKIQKCLARPDVCLDKPVKCKQKNHKAFSHPLYPLFMNFMLLMYCVILRSLGKNGMPIVPKSIMITIMIPI